MNKILVVEDINELKDGEYIIDTYDNAHILAMGNNIIHEYNSKSNNLVIDVKSNSNLKFYQVKILDNDYKIKINVLDKAILDYHVLILNKGKHRVDIDINMPESDAKANVIARCINLENHSNLNIICNGIIDAKTKDNELLENLKGLIIYDDDSIKISPNMLVDANEVMANHLVTIGTFDKESLFYLKMRGLSENLAKKLLIESFITNIMSDYEIEKIKMEVKNYE